MAYDLSLGAVRALAMPEFEHRMGVILQQQGCKGFERHPSVANFMSGMTVAQVMNNTPIDIAGTLPPAALINAGGAGSAQQQVHEGGDGGRERERGVAFGAACRRSWTLRITES